MTSAKPQSQLPASDRSQLERIFTMKYGAPEQAGWGPRMRLRFGYFNPDDHYESMVDRLVTPGSSWLDVGCGRKLFPSNVPLGEELSKRCGLLVGVDPDETLLENPFVHEKVLSGIDCYKPDRTYDLLTMRMVAEHVVDPDPVVRVLRDCVKPGGYAVIYTVYRFSPVPLITDLVPMFLRHPVKKLLWRTEAKDTFPTAFKMNTRPRLQALMGGAGFEEAHFELLDDCRSFGRFRLGQWSELWLRRLLGWVGFGYPERCVFGVYRRKAD